MPYYYDDDNHEKICLNKCDKLYKKDGNKLICTDICGNNEHILPGNICSNSDCPSNAPFQLKEGSTTINIKWSIHIQPIIPSPNLQRKQENCFLHS